ncbi:hypothetical protein Cgig2_002574 [Carnegiea gigantea]|uniref:DNA-directed RNA polymerase n=1 Tax=Carnegiea gigantea TaxID=171969 RepID=A0A9Q1GKK7_9CARY|nr:hypothetical protein Cgig2_002574 [Carnegiea gigantea]
MNIEKRIDGWNEHLTRIHWIPGGLMIGAKLTIVESLHSLVNKIQKVYRSQEMQIHNRHIEIIVQLIGLLWAKRTGRALEEAICSRAILLGIMRASRHTQGFLSDASFCSSFSNSCSPGPSGLAERTKRKRCSRGNETCWYWIQRINTPFKSTKEHSLEKKKKKDIRGRNERDFVLP